MAIAEFISSGRSIVGRWLSKNWPQPGRSAARPAADARAVAEPAQNDRWWEDENLKRTIFDDLVNWLQCHIEINPNWTALEFGAGESGFARFYKDYVARM